ncbi:MAG TPA: protein kinase [Terriglobia bacterium]|nr:protein kinase [Terriglobia bacterium]
MQPERWQEIDRLFHAALRREKNERHAFLASACAGNKDLRREVESLLEVDEQAGSFLETPAIEEAAEALARAESESHHSDDLQLAGSTVYHYHILKKLGGGGMGIVYEAEDTQLGRRVALKFLPIDAAADARSLERFHREARAASALGHPNICTVYDIGEHDGRPFIAMELIEGQTIAEVVRRGPLATEEAVGISRQIAEALVEAHERNIIHRDLKPANVMVTAKGRVKVLDFGLAKWVRPVEADASTEESLSQTRPGAIMGTIPYMAPEQLRGEAVDRRTDLYALGVILYEMATGVRPFPEEDTTRLIVAILTQAPRAPRELNPRITPQLEAVILRALAKEQEKRYQTAQELLADLGYSNKVASLAAAPSEAWWRPTSSRRRATLILTAGTVTAALAAILFLAVPALQRHLKLSSSSWSLPNQKQLAVLPFSVRGGMPDDNAFSRGLAETVAAKLTELSPDRSLQVVPVGDLSARHVETATEAQKAFGVNLVLTGSFERVGDRVRISYALVDPSSIRQLRAETLTLAASDPFGIEDRVVQGTAAMLRLDVPPAARQSVELHGTKVAGAFEEYLKGLGYLQNYERAENIDKAVDSFQSALNVDSAYTLAHAGLGQAYWLKYTATADTGWVDKAQESCGHAVTLDSKLPASHLCLGILESGTGRYAQAAGQFQKVLEAEPTNTSAYQGLADAQYHLKRTSEAEATYQRAISMRPNYWAPYNWLGVLYFNTGQSEKAAVMFKKVNDLAPGNHVGLYNLGAAYYVLGKWPEAEEVLKKSIANHPSEVAYSNLGTLQYSEGHFGQSAGYLEKAVQLNPKDAMLWGNLADAYKWSSHGRVKAVTAYQRAAALTRDGLRVNPKSYDKLGELATYEAQSSNFKQAMHDLRRALSFAPKDVQLMYNAALVYRLAGQRARALEYLRRAIRSGYPVQAIRSDPEWSALKVDPEFQELVQTESH